MSERPEGFSIDVGSDQEHERLVADIYYHGRYVGSVTEEGEIGRFDFEQNWQAPGAESDVARCPLSDFILVLQQAAARLKKMTHLGGAT